MTTHPDLPDATDAELRVLFSGYVGEHVASTVTLVLDGDVRIVVDPGMVPSQAAILEPLERLGLGPRDISDVVFSHHHPDHTLNAALFPGARFHDHWAVYQGDRWDDREAEGARLSPSVRLIRTPGHSPEDITTLVGTPEGVAACTHLWWSVDGPPEDPRATDPEALHAGRQRVLAVATLIVPGHGAPFAPTPTTPR
jgi:glyoxylase-like metal-dependent hydrolase (beta-lactamase superfamily II)